MLAAQGRIAVLPVDCGRWSRAWSLGLTFVVATAAALPPCGIVAADETSEPIAAELSLSQKIDVALQPRFAAAAAGDEQDGVMLRRLSLDLRGVVPTREELDAFVADASTERWSDWVDRFLQDPLCDEHLVSFLDRTLMLRRGFTHVDRAAWISYLRDHVAANTPLDALSRELLYTPWWTNENRPAQRFYLDRTGDANLITRDVARVFLGRDLQWRSATTIPLSKTIAKSTTTVCWHSSPPVAWPKRRTRMPKTKIKRSSCTSNCAAGDAPFESVFERGTMLRSGPRLPDQAEQFDDYLRPDQRYAAEAPAGAIAAAPLPPIHSRRQQLAGLLAAPDNRSFVANWANRLWALVYGQGLVSPLDMIHPENPAANPELFELIADGLLGAELRIKPFLRQLVMAQAYRRGRSPQLLRLSDDGDPQVISELSKQVAEQLVSLETDTKSLVENETAALSAYETAARNLVEDPGRARGRPQRTRPGRGGHAGRKEEA